MHRRTEIDPLYTLPLMLLIALLAPFDASAQSLRGSPASVDRIYQQAVDHGLQFFETGAGIQRAFERGEIVRLEDNADFRLHDVSYPYTLPVTRVFVERLAAQYRAACGEQMVVTSALRPRSFRLANSVARSVHPTGIAIDLRKPANHQCLTWLRTTLLTMERAGIIEAVEERRPPHFHVAVFPRPYLAHVRQLTGDAVLAQAVPEVQELRYEVRRGDTLWSIARRHNTTVDALKDVNALSDSGIAAGQTIVIPAIVR